MSALFAVDMAGTRCMAVDVDSRVRIVAACTDLQQLHDALQLIGLQKSVRAAIERRLRQLARERAARA